MRAALQSVALTLVFAVPVAAGADVRLLDEELRPPGVRVALLALQPGEPADGQQGNGKKQADEGDPANGGLDFDLLGDATPPPVPPEDRAMRRRRQILGLHQTVGIGLFSLQVATTVVGQLNYNDKFGDSNTNRYKLSHAVLAYSTLGVFAATGALALLAPDAPAKPDRGFDRVTLHKVSMFTAAAGIAAQVALGIWTARREGYENKQDIGRVHLAVGYATLAAVTAGVGAIVF